MKALSAHFYPQTNCDKQKEATIKETMSSSLRSYSESVVTKLIKNCTDACLPVRMNETNSVSCDGAKGVSDVYASTIWALDYALMVQRQGATDVDFHSSLGRCGDKRPVYKYYTPFCAVGKEDEKSGTLTAAPEWAAIAAARSIPAGKYVGVENSGWQHVRAFAIARDTSLSVVLVDTDDPKNLGAIPVSIDVGSSFTKAESATLSTTSSKGLKATNGIELGGRQLGTNGKFDEAAQQSVALENNAAKVTVKPATVTIVTLR